MKRILKQVIGIDVAQKELVVCYGRMFDDCSLEVYSAKAFENNNTGFGKLLSWVNKTADKKTVARFVMEATGVYHEPLAYFLVDKQLEVSIVLPNKISNYVRTLEVKTITDKTAAEAIAQFGLERKLDMWQRPRPAYKTLRQLTRERSQIIDIRTITKNHLHAEKSEAEPNESSIERFKKHIAFLNKQEKQITSEIAETIKRNEEVKEAVGILSSLVGVGMLTSASVLSETNGFDLIKNKRQLTSYAGFDVKEKQSGTSVKGKPKISKRGNKYLRKAMHMPALSAIRSDPRYKGIYARLIAKHGIKMKATVAVQRKLLELMYTLFKNQVKYDKNYLAKEEVEVA